MQSSILGAYNSSHHDGSPPRCYSDILWRDVHGVARSFMSNEAMARVFRRLADRFQGVVTDTSMMTISPNYAAQVLEVHVKTQEQRKRKVHW